MVALVLVLAAVAVLIVARAQVIPSRAATGVVSGPDGASSDTPQAASSEWIAAGAAEEARLEHALAVRVESLLSRVVGEGRVEVAVRAELDRSQREETSERFDPDGQVERVEERTPAAAGALAERVEYDVGKHVTRTVTPAGAIRRLHVAILVDGRPAPVGSAGEGFTPWSADELVRLEALAKQAVGYSAERGDVLTLTSAPLRMPASGLFAMPLGSVAAEGLRTLALAALLALLGSAAFRVAGRAPAMAGLPMPAGELEALLLRAGEIEDASREASDRSPTAETPRAAPTSDESAAGVAAIRSWLEE